MDRRATRRNVLPAAAAGTVIPNDGCRRDLLLQKSSNASENHLKEDIKMQNGAKVATRTERRASTMMGRSLVIVAVFVALQLLYFLYVHSRNQNEQKQVSAIYRLFSASYVSYH